MDKLSYIFYRISIHKSVLPDINLFYYFIYNLRKNGHHGQIVAGIIPQKKRRIDHTY